MALRHSTELPPLLLAVREIGGSVSQPADIKGKQLQIRRTMNVIGLIPAVEPTADS
jgi:hypothetical protein